MQIARRKLLSMMAALPFASSLGKWASAAPAFGSGDTKSYYVWVHGLFGISLQPHQIMLACPDLTACTLKRRKSDKCPHIYRAGRITATEPSPNNQGFPGTYAIDCPGTYSITGLSGSMTYEKLPDGLDNGRELIKTPGDLKSNDQYSFLTYQVPYPDSIHPLRFINIKIHECCDPNGVFPDGGRLPLLHVFEYKNSDPARVALINLETNKPVPISAQDNHLHLFTEQEPHLPSDSNPCPDDRDGPMQALLDCYDNISRFRFEPDNADCVQLSNIFKIASNFTEQLSLFEWLGNCQEPPPQPGSNTGNPTVTAHECPSILVSSAFNVPSSALSRSKQKRNHVR